MRYFYCIGLLVVLLYSCKTLHVIESKSVDNVKSIGIEWCYTEQIDTIKRHAIDLMMNDIIQKFNSEKHAFSIHRKEARDKNYISFGFGKYKLASKGNRFLGYILGFTGMVALPVTMALSDLPLIFFIGYIPTHKLRFAIKLSPELSNNTTKMRIVFAETNLLLANYNKQADKLLSKSASQVLRALTNIEEQLLKHSLSENK